MRNPPDHMRVLDHMITEAVAAGAGHHTAEDERLGGRTVRIEGRDLVQFASCSYLGLELDPRVIAGVVDAAERHGSQFSSSRVFVSAPLYRELEETLSLLFGQPTLVAPSTTLAHLAALPVLVSPHDVVLLDHHVHNSVQMATNQLSVAGSPVELVRHHDLDHLEERVRELSKKHSRVWFLVDGVCSMFGDLAPIEAYRELLDRYECLHLYVDDAHGMSWCGPSGRGYALTHGRLHPRMVVATSLNKAFGAAGGALVFPDSEMRRRVRACGATLLFSGPIQPPMLGGALASARLHLEPEFRERQQRYEAHARRCRALLEASGLSTPADPLAPVQFVGVGLPRDAQALVRALMNEGYFTNVAQFPAVPMKNAGVRFTLTLHQRDEDLVGLVDALAHLHDQTARDAAQRDTSGGRRRSPRLLGGTSRLRLERAMTIRQLDKRDWDAAFADRANFSWDALTLLEDTFARETDPRSRWNFHYYRVLDREGRLLAATFCTDALWKADMLSPADVSRAVEAKRRRDPFHLTQRVFSMGCLLTEGNHLYLDPALGRPGSRESQRVLTLLLAAIQKDATSAQCEAVALRDLEDTDPALEGFLRREGFLQMGAPESYEVEIDWQDEQEFVAGLSAKHRYHYRRQVEPFNDEYRMDVYRADTNPASGKLVSHFHALYRNVRERSLELNTFELPERLFHKIAQNPHWELIALTPTDACDDALPVGISAIYIGEQHEVPLVVGLDYDYVENHGLYRQALRHTLLRAQALGRTRVCFGMGAGLEKRRVGARVVPRFLYLQINDHYVVDAIARMSLDQAAASA